MTAGPRSCRRCGKPIPAGVLGGNCARCLVVLALSTTDDGETPVNSRVESTPPTPVAQFFGDYEILGELARGGMGVVYRARQVSLNRPVALKMIASGQLATAGQVQRFKLEAEAAARFDHPNIVPIYEVGEHQSRHFYSMKLVEGGNLADWIRRAVQPRKETSGNLSRHDCHEDVAARLVATVARAVHYAHQRGVLHRDLKPTNILIDSKGEPHVTDFGLAKFLEDDTSLTQSIAVLGTPAYMAPELAAGHSSAATTATDVYSLGAILYELIVGRPPFHAENVPALLRKIVEDGPVRPSLARRTWPDARSDTLDPNLEVICLKCLEKRPAQRYASAADLAEDLERWGRDEAISARPSTPIERLRRWCLRKPVVASLLLTVALLLAAGVVGILVALQHIDTARRDEKRERRAAERANLNLESANQELAASVERLESQVAEDFFRAGDVSSALAHLASVVRSNPSNQIATSRLFSAVLHRNYPIPAAPAIGTIGRVLGSDFNRDGRRLLILREDPLRDTVTARVWDATHGQPITRPFEHAGRVLSAVFSPDGQHVATGADDRTARIWDANSGQPLTTPMVHSNSVRLVRFSPDGRSVMTLSELGTLRLWDAVQGTNRITHYVHSTRATDARFSADGELIVTGSDRGSVRTWKTRDLTEGGTPIVVPASVSLVQLSPDAHRILTISGDYAARLWNRTNGEPVGEPMRHREVIESATFSPDGKQLVTASRDRTVQIWDAFTGRPIGPPLRHKDAVTVVRFSPDGRWVASGSWDNTAHVWDVQTHEPACGPLRFTERVFSIDFSPDSQRLVTGSEDGIVQVWDIRSSAARELILPHAGAVNLAVFSQDGRIVATASDDTTARVWDAVTGKPITPPLFHTLSVLHADLSPDGRLLATASADRLARVWEVSTGRAVTSVNHGGEVLRARFDPTSLRIVTASRDRTARVWDAKSGAALTPPLRHKHSVRDACFSPDGCLVATTSWDHSATLWNATTGEPVAPSLLHGDLVESVQFSPDGSRLLTAAHDNSARLWDARTGAAIGASMRHTRSVYFAAFNTDGSRIVTASWDRTARVWDGWTGRVLSDPMRHDDQLLTAFFSRDGRRIVTSSLDGTARVWDTKTGRSLSEPLRHRGKVFSAQFSPDGQSVLTASADGSARIWYVPDVPVPSPSWLPNLAESLGGLLLDAQRNFAFAGRSAVDDLRSSPPQPKPGQEFFTRFRDWFFADRQSRPSAPGARE